LLLFLFVTLPKCRNRYPRIKLIIAQRILYSGADNPSPGGSAKADGKLLPIMPLIKWGKVLIRQIPAKKA